MLGVEISRPNSKLFIMRGISGAGKSTIAEKLAKEHNGIILSADNEIIELGDGNYSRGYSYVSDKGKTAISIAHGRVKWKLIDLSQSEDCIIIDNTNLNRSSVKQHIEIVLNNGYDEKNIEIVDIGLNGLTIDELASRNKHNVTKEVITKMVNSYNAAGKFEVETIFEFNTDEEERIIKTKENFIDVLNNYYDNGWLIKHVNDELGLIIWNYSTNTTYEGKWDNITMMCRSLVTDFNGVIVSRGFNKFFNYAEIRYTYKPEVFIDSEFYEKVDGSYIAIFWYKDQWVVRSKGSFDTPQAEKAKELFNNYSDEVKNSFKKTLTHNFEVLYPENQIVVNYNGFEGLVYLATTSRKGDHFIMKDLDSSVTKAKTYDFIMDYKAIKNMDDGINEGFVGKTKDGMLFKIKFDTYIANHAIITNTSSYDIWNAMRIGTIDDFLSIIPDECYEYVKRVRAEIEKERTNLLNEIYATFNKLDKTLSKKDFAIKYKNEPHISHFFRLYDGLEISDEVIWKKVKPKYSTPTQTIKVTYE